MYISISAFFKILSFNKGPEDGPMGPKLVASLKHYKKIVLCLTVLFVNPVINT